MASNSQRDSREEPALRGVGLRIARRRLALGWTRRQLAQRLDMRPSELGRYENGTAQPTAAALRRIGRILGVPAEVLLSEGGEPAPALASERRGRPRRQPAERTGEPIGRAERFAARLAAWTGRD